MSFLKRLIATLYKFLMRLNCGPLGKGVWMELPYCCLKGV